MVYWADTASLTASSSMTMRPVMVPLTPPSSVTSVSGTSTRLTSTPRMTSTSGKATTTMPAQLTQKLTSGSVPTTTPTPSANWFLRGSYFCSGGVRHQSSSRPTGSGLLGSLRWPFMTNRPLKP